MFQAIDKPFASYLEQQSVEYFKSGICIAEDASTLGGIGWYGYKTGYQDVFVIQNLEKSYKPVFIFSTTDDLL